MHQRRCGRLDFVNIDIAVGVDEHEIRVLTFNDRDVLPIKDLPVSVPEHQNMLGKEFLPGTLVLHLIG